MVMRLQELNHIEGFRVGVEVIPILQYADDTLVLLQDNQEALRKLKITLYWFRVISGLQLN